MSSAEEIDVAVRVAAIAKLGSRGSTNVYMREDMLDNNNDCQPGCCLGCIRIADASLMVGWTYTRAA